MSITLLKIDDAVNEIINRSSPVLFLDTCTLLDIIRLPFRQKSPTTAKSFLESVGNANQLIKRSKLSLVILPPVLKEWNNNLPNTKAELSRHIREIILRLEILSAIHSSGAGGLVVPDLLSLKTESFLETICNDLILSAIHIEQDNDLVLKANDRVVNNIPPSRKGTIKDCIIYEHCLQITSLLRSEEFTENIIFFTSNTKDFCVSNGNAKQPINDELSNLSIRLCLNWSWAINEAI